MKNKIKNLDAWIGRKIGLDDFTKKDLERYQFEALKKILKQVSENSPFYQKKMANFPLESIQSLKDIEKLPLTDEADLRKEAMNFLAVNQKLVKRIVTLNSSGTTGQAKRIFFTEKDLELTIDFFKNGMSLFTRENDRVLILLPGKQPASIGDLLKKALHRLGAEGIIYGVVDDASRVSKIIRDQQITGIVGIPQQVLSVSMEVEAALISEKGVLRTVLLSTDYCSPALVSKIEQQWHVSVYEHYGSTEMGYGGGVFCDVKSGYHLREADFYFEIIDPGTLKPLAPGQTGEVVFTTLTRQAMPLIRYRTGDISRFLKAPCPCLTPLKTMARIAHRSENKIKMGENSEFTLSFLEDLIFLNPQVEDFRAVIKDPDRLAIELVFKKELSQVQKKTNICEVEKTVSEAFKVKMGDQFSLQISQGSPSLVDLKGMQKRKIIDRRTNNE